MSKIRLKAFQEEAVSTLVEELNHCLNSNSRTTPRFVFQSPTGSGKTVMAGEVFERLFHLNPNIVILWASIGDGGLHHQSRQKFKKQLPKDIQVLSAEESLRGGQMFLNGKTIVTFSWQEINNKKKEDGSWDNVIMRDGEHLNFRELITHTQAQRPVLLFIDEAHSKAKTFRSTEIISMFNPYLVLEVTATPTYLEFKKDKAYEKWISFSNKGLIYKGYRVDPERVSGEELICKDFRVNYGVDFEKKQTDFEAILETAYQKHLELKEGYKEHQVTPLLLVQIPNSTEGEMLRKRVEEYLEQHHITTENNRLNIWLNNDHVLSDNLTKNTSSVEVLIFKQSITTGWDCPRAKVLLQFRDVKKKDTQLQIVGRILRMPEQKHYENNLLNTAFAYTDIKEPTLTEDILKLGVVKDLLSTRQTMLPYSLISTFQAQKVYSHLVVEDLVEPLKKALTHHFKLDFNHVASDGINMKRLKEYGTPLDKRLIFGSISRGYGSIGSLDSIEYQSIPVLKDPDRVILECKSFLKKYLKPFGDKDFETNYQTFMNVLIKCFRQHVFKETTPSLLQYHLTAYREIWEKCLSEALKSFHKIQQDDEIYKKYEYEWNLPSELAFSREKVETDLVFNHYAYSPSFLLKDRSNPEQMFEALVDNHPNVKWWYKNGKSGRDHLGIGYTTSDGNRKVFYPDYLVFTTDETLWIYETKGYGELNIDEKVEEKTEALAQFIERHQALGLSIEGSVIAPYAAGWYAYQTQTGENFKSSKCWKRTKLFAK